LLARDHKYQIINLSMEYMYLLIKFFSALFNPPDLNSPASVRLGR